MSEDDLAPPTLPTSDEPVGHVLGTGIWRDFIPRIPRPVFAMGSKALFRVLLSGSGFSLPVEGQPDPLIGFFTTRFVAARTVREAQDKARSAVLHEWSRGGYETRANGLPTLTIEDLEDLHTHFHLRSGVGFTFY